MIDIDERPPAGIQSADAGALHAVTFQDDRRIVFSVHFVGALDGIRMRKAAVDDRNTVTHHHVHIFAQFAKREMQAENRTDGVAIRTSVRGQHEAFVVLYRLEDLSDHDYSDCSLRARFATRPRSVSMRLSNLSDWSRWKLISGIWRLPKRSRTSLR